MISKRCGKCGGSGRVNERKRLTVNIPPGVHDGQVLRLRGEGEPGSQGHRGDLHCVIRIKHHPFLMRQGNDLIMELPISFTQAALGDRLEIPTLKEKEEIVIPKGSQPGDIVRLRGKGLPDLRTQNRGDLIVRLLVEIPKKLSAKQQELLKEFAKTENRTREAMPTMSSFWDKIKQYFGNR